MRIIAISLIHIFIFLAFAPPTFAQDAVNSQTIEQIAADAEKSVVVIMFAGRDGEQQGLGSGFVVSRDGLIATNLHVIGEARPITVQFPDGTKHRVTEIHASDRKMDLAILRIDAKDLKPLPLGDSDSLKKGEPIVALGHPQGFKYSVVSGVASGRRKVEGMAMIQLALPIEKGNSGGPVLDRKGRVHGIVTMKSLVTANLGFAAPSNSLQSLLKRPNPIPMSRWLTIGQLDKREWETKFGGSWRQRAGRIIADDMGSGFGGRTMCLSKTQVPETPYEVAVTVKLDDESGAAGLVWGSDGDNKHYGFYPSGGRLRLTRFAGPDVYSWTILKQWDSDHYRTGDWNTLKVRVEKDKSTCFLNGHVVAETTDNTLKGDIAGIVKFRSPGAQFKRFRIARKIPSVIPPKDVVERLTKLVRDIPLDETPPEDLAKKLLPDGSAAIAVLRDRARLLEKQAEHLRELALEVHHKRILKQLAEAVNVDHDKIDLLRAALLLAAMDNEEIEVSAYQKAVDRLADEITKSFPKKADEQAKWKALNRFLFQELGFHGSRVNYYTRHNSYLNEVIDDREGLPITLSVLYMEVARRVGLNVVGIPMPGHFIVRLDRKDGRHQLIDVYDSGKTLSRKEAAQIVENITGEPFQEAYLQPASKKDILIRMLHNLINVADREGDHDGLLRYLDGILTVKPDAAEERWVRAVLRYQKEMYKNALEDVDWLLTNRPVGIRLSRVQELRRVLEEKLK